MISHAPQPIQIVLPFAAEDSSVNAYLFLDPAPTLIDTGDASEECWQALCAGLAAHGLAMSDLERVVITHTHIDHFGQAARISQESDAQFFTIDAGYIWVTDFSGQWRTRLDYYRDEFLPGVDMPASARARVLHYSQAILDTYRSVPADRVTCLEDGDPIQLGGSSWTALHTPGHASMLTCFYAPQSATLLSSDLVLARTPTPVVESPAIAARYGQPLPTHLRSLARIASLEIATTLPGHGSPIRDTSALIASQLRRIQQRKAECLELVRTGVDTVFSLMQAMYTADSQPINMAGLWMVAGYLDLLQEEMLVHRRTADGVWRFEVENYGDGQ